jgi:SAM-dependent methyltransferase
MCRTVDNSGYTAPVHIPISRNELKNSVRDYWDKRARGYSEATRVALQEGQDDIIRIIGRFINLNRRLRVVDMGTGPGLFAILMAMRGHEVTAIDNSEEMLKRARNNAVEMDVEINFILGDIEEPPLEKGSYDLIVAHNSTWCLTKPAKAYAAWKELLVSDGELAIIDGNYYLDQYDDEYLKRKNYMELKRTGRNDGLHGRTNVDNVDFTIIEDLAYDLPLSRERRPSWDVRTLLGIGMTDIHVKTLDKEPFSILTENGTTALPFTFVICAKMPIYKTPYESVIKSPAFDEKSVRWAIKSSCGREKGLSTFMKAVSEKHRLRIINALFIGFLNVQQISSISGCSQSLCSHNLTILREAGVVETKKIGRESVYYLKDRSRMQILIEMCDIMSRGMQNNKKEKE